MLTLIATELVGDDKVSKMINYHSEGYLLGPSPSYSPNEE